MNYLILGFTVGVAFMKVMAMFAMRECCRRHFLQHVKGDACQHGTCRGPANHYGYCNLHSGEGA